MSTAAISAELQFVTFSLGNELFAVPVDVVQEILDHEEAFKIPQGPDYLLGLRDVRGQRIPVIDLRRRLGMTALVRTPHSRVLVLNVPVGDKALALGLVADRVYEVVSFRPRQIEAAPDIGASWRSDYVGGVVRRDQGFVVIIDLARLFSEAGLSPCRGVASPLGATHQHEDLFMNPYPRAIRPHAPKSVRSTAAWLSPVRNIRSS